MLVMEGILAYSGVVILLCLAFIGWPLLLWIRIKRKREEGKIVLAREKKTLNNAIMAYTLSMAWLVITIITIFLFK